MAELFNNIMSCQKFFKILYFDVQMQEKEPEVMIS